MTTAPPATRYPGVSLLLAVRANRAYQIGKENKKKDVGLECVVMWLVPGLGFLGLGIFHTLRDGDLDLIGLLMGSLFIGLAIWLFFCQKRRMREFTSD
jgi:hypothetical protein